MRRRAARTGRGPGGRRPGRPGRAAGRPQSGAGGAGGQRGPAPGGRAGRRRAARRPDQPAAGPRLAKATGQLAKTDPSMPAPPASPTSAPARPPSQGQALAATLARPPLEMLGQHRRAPGPPAGGWMLTRLAEGREGDRRRPGAPDRRRPPGERRSCCAARRGPVLAVTLLADLHVLGRLDRREVAKLVVRRWPTTAGSGAASGRLGRRATVRCAYRPWRRPLNPHPGLLPAAPGERAQDGGAGGLHGKLLTLLNASCATGGLGAGRRHWGRGRLGRQDRSPPRPAAARRRCSVLISGLDI